MFVNSVQDSDPEDISLMHDSYLIISLHYTISPYMYHNDLKITQQTRSDLFQVLQIQPRSP